ncbi:hypothetical protein QYE76_004987 [Lolium multiflorum]|uniref:Uncharacterized protein n=1 Tax=Lolium multiflorum TaxID=4521 RepID=A0AAD8RU34_LOLMU|nr:hypothetical protein QYE76_004987 [Lolium multiflorum]
MKTWNVTSSAQPQIGHRLEARESNRRKKLSKMHPAVLILNHIPVYVHWKKYRQDQGLLCDLYGKVAGEFSMDTKQSPVKGACNKHLQNDVENLLSQDLCCLQNDRVHSSINKLDGKVQEVRDKQAALEARLETLTRSLPE